MTKLILQRIFSSRITDAVKQWTFYTYLSFFFQEAFLVIAETHISFQQNLCKAINCIFSYIYINSHILMYILIFSLWLPGWCDGLDVNKLCPQAHLTLLSTAYVPLAVAWKSCYAHVNSVNTQTHISLTYTQIKYNNYKFPNRLGSIDKPRRCVPAVPAETSASNADHSVLNTQSSWPTHVSTNTPAGR